MNTEKKFKKKKEREKKVKEKLAKRRTAIRALAAEKKAEEDRLEAEFLLVHGKAEPILNDPEAIARREAKKKANVEERLKRNLAILESLEREYDQEQAIRTQVNEKLEAEGHTTVKDKLAALTQKAKDIQQRMQGLPQVAQGATPAPLTDKEIGLAAEFEKARRDVEKAANIGPDDYAGTGLRVDDYPVIDNGVVAEHVVEAKTAEEEVRGELSESGESENIN